MRFVIKPKLYIKYLSEMPIYKIDFSINTEKIIYDRITVLVEKILLQKTTNKPDTSVLETATDGLTEVEIRLVADG